MSRPNNNRWKTYRRDPSSTADARRALAIMFASAISAELEISDSGYMFIARFPSSDGIGPVEAPTLALLAIRICASVPSSWLPGRGDSIDVNPMLLRCCEKIAAANNALAEVNARLVDAFLDRCGEQE